ncbi:MAG TPA: hypothetical protein VN853_17220 [Polyangia bacterium]|nr:hypothetical protein [Polyangia bacterium]
MKVIVVLTLLSLAACEGQQPQQIFAISQPPIAVPGSQSRLPVPTSCPVYAPGGGDIDTPEAPFPKHVTIMCAIDDTGRTYGLVEGDAPTATMPMVAGDHELGFYIGFDAGAGFTADEAVLDGTSPNLAAYAGPFGVSSQDCCPENHPEDRLAPTTVAVNDAGWLVSLGFFNESPTQVAVTVNTEVLLPPGSTPGNSGFGARFYVNGSP